MASQVTNVVELASKFSAASLTGKAGGHESNRADQQDNQFGIIQ